MNIYPLGETEIKPGKVQQIRYQIHDENVMAAKDSSLELRITDLAGNSVRLPVPAPK
jgi:hypothetical protein